MNNSFKYKRFGLYENRKPEYFEYKIPLLNQPKHFVDMNYLDLMILVDYDDENVVFLTKHGLCFEVAGHVDNCLHIGTFALVS